MTYTQAALERAMKVHEVLMQALNGRQPWMHVAEVLGVSARTVRRLRARTRPSAQPPSPYAETYSGLTRRHRDGDLSATDYAHACEQFERDWPGYG